MPRPPIHPVLRLLTAVPVTLAVSCGTVTAAALPVPVPPSPRIAEPSPVPPKDESAAPDLLDAVAAIEPDATVGALVIDRRTGDQAFAAAADRQFRSASLVKLLIALDVLEHDTGSPAGPPRPVAERDRERLATMLATSDDQLASSYWVAGGYSDIIHRMSAELGLTATEPPEQPGRWGEVRISASDVARVYQHVLAMPTADRQLVLGALADAPRYAADGFDQHFGIPDGLSGSWAVKQGWGDNETAMVLHSTGLAGKDWRYIVVLLTEHPLGTDWGTAADALTAAASSLSVLPDATH